MAIEAQLVDITDIAQNVPFVREPIVPRDHILDTVDGAFDQGFEVVLVEAAENLGKTILLYLAAKRHASASCCLFVRGSSVYSYHPTAIRTDLCTQLHWVLKGTIPRDDLVCDEATLRQLVLDVQRQAARKRTPFYFIVDGLDELSEEVSALTDIVRMLPIGTTWFRLLLSSTGGARLRRALPSKAKIKDYPLSSFGIPEVREYFQDRGLTDEQIRDLYLITKGNPGHLNTIRRVLDEGVTIDTVSEHREVRDLFAIEWEQFACKGQSVLDAIRYVAFARHKITIEELAGLTAQDVATLQSTLQSASFLDINLTTRQVGIVSPSLARFIRSKFANEESKTLAAITRKLLETPFQGGDRELVAEYLAASKNNEGLLEYLNYKYFVEGIRKAQSLLRLKRQAEMGARISDEIKSPDMLRFALLVSVVSSLFEVTAAKAEVQALMAVGDYERATSVAYTAALPEDRLLLLAAIARFQVQRGGQPEAVMREQLATLADEFTDSQVDPDKAISIAAELFSVLPDHALRIVRTASSNQTAGNSFDMALVQLSFEALTRNAAAATETSELLRERIDDKETRSVIGTLSMFLSPKSAQDVLLQVQEIAEPSDRLLTLRLWCRTHPSTTDAIVVSEHALTLALASTEVSVNASFYRDIAAPLRHSDDIAAVRKLVGAFDGQSAVFERVGPAEEVARTNLRLAQAEAKYDRRAAVQRLLTLYLTTGTGFVDTASRAAFYAELYLVGRSIKGDRTDNELGDIIAAALEELDSCISTLLSQSADHMGVFRELLTTLGEQDLTRALELAEKLNSPRRRDWARLCALEVSTRGSLSSEWLSLAQTALRATESSMTRDRAAEVVVRTLSRQEQRKAHPHFARPTSLEIAGEILSPSRRAASLGRILLGDLATGHTPVDGETPALFDSIRAALAVIDRPWLRIQVTFEVATELAKESPGLATVLIEDAREARRDLPLQSKSGSNSFHLLVDLCIRAFGAVVSANDERSGDFETLSQVISSEPSMSDQAAHWEHLLFIYLGAQRIDRAKAIAFQQLVPCIEAIHKSNPARRYALIAGATAGLWMVNRQFAEELYDQCPPPFRDDAYGAVCQSLLSGMRPTEPYSWKESQQETIEYSTAIDVLSVLAKLDEDSRIYWLLELTVRRIERARRKSRLSQDQCQDLARRVEDHILTGLPNPKYIAHEGYKILVEALVCKIRSDWRSIDGILGRAEKLENIADRALVLSELAGLMPERELSKRRKLLEQASAIAHDLPSKFDQIQRQYLIAEVAEGIDKSLAKKAISEAFKRSTEADDVNAPEAIRAQLHRVIAIAYSIDPELANSLAALLNDDPAKRNARNRVRQILAETSLKSRLLNEKERSPRFTDSEDISAISESSWHCLAELNAGRALPVHAQRVHEILGKATKFDIEGAYPICALVIENQRRMYMTNEQGRAVARATFDTLVRTCRFAEQALHILAHSPYQRRLDIDRSGRQVIIGEGDQERALKLIREWLTGQSSKQFLICDPHFTIEDLELLRIFQEAAPLASIHVLTGEESQKSTGAVAYETSYRAKWQALISSIQDPPDTTITVVGVQPDGKAPFHDRWLLCEDGGLRFGTSFSGFGKRMSEISTIDRGEAQALLDRLENYASQRTRRHLTQRIRYSAFSL